MNNIYETETYQYIHPCSSIEAPLLDLVSLNAHRSSGVTNIFWLDPYFVLFEKKRKQHQHASIMHNPPHINVAFIVTLMVAGVERHIFGNQEGQMGCSCAANSTCPKGEKQTVTSNSARVSYGLKQKK